MKTNLEMKWLKKFFKKDRRGFLTLLIIFLVLVIVDLISTLRLGELAQYLEINPFFKNIGFIGIIFLNIWFVVMFYWVYNRKKTGFNTRFIIVLILVMAIFVRGTVIINTFQVAEDPPALEEVKQITQEQKTEYFKSYFWRNLLSLLIPYLIGFVTFLFFKMDHVIKKKWLD